MYAIAFSGYRPHKLFGMMYGMRVYKELTATIKQQVKSFIIRKNLTEVVAYIGMSWGYDMLAGDALVELREELKDTCKISIVAAIPYKCQPERFKYGWDFRYWELLDLVDEKVYVDAEPNYRSMTSPIGDFAYDKLTNRNNYMADKMQTTFVCYDGQRGGTYNYIKYVEKHYPDKELLYLNPKEWLAEQEGLR